MQDTRLDIAGRYIPFAGDGLGRCLEEVPLEPAVGDYGTAPPDPIPAEVTSQHIDQMTGHGINRMTFVFNGKPRNFDYVSELLEADFIDQISIEPSYSVLAFWNNEERNWKQEVLPEQLSFIRENLISRDNAAIHEGRPMMHTWNIINLANNDAYQEKINKEFGGFESFVEDIRGHLRTGGRDPFLVAGTASVDNYLYRDKDVNELVTQFDAVCPWIAASLDSDKQIAWRKALEDTELVYSEQSKFAKRNNMEFIPTIYPGFNEKENSCYNDPGRHLLRSLEKFKQMLELAEQYSSSGRVNIATWNDWVEGTQIEPGSYRGTNYGTAYVEVVKEFQQM